MLICTVMPCNTCAAITHAHVMLENTKHVMFEQLELSHYTLDKIYFVYFKNFERNRTCTQNYLKLKNT